MTRTLAALALGSTLGCKDAPPANPEFDDAVAFAFSNFDADTDEVAYAVRALEEQVYLSMDVEASSAADRGLTLSPLTDEHVTGLEHPGRDLSRALPVAVAALSPHDIALHPQVQLLEDHTVVEPYSPTFYERTFLDGESCWEQGSCERLSTFNDLIKENALMEVRYNFLKDFRWIDLNLPDPSTAPDGEVAVNEGEPRWAYIARSWTTEEFSGESDNTHLRQSFTVEMWLPRDGGGFVRDGSEINADGGEWTADSTGGGTLRVLALWSETEFDGLDIGDDLVIRTTRAGIDKNFKAADDWLTEQIEESDAP